MPLRFRPSANERGLTFGLTWSAVGCALAMVGLTSCGYIIPEDNRPPRYNSVMGERRTPLLNNAVGANTPPPVDEEAYPQSPAEISATAPMQAASMPQGGGVPTASVSSPGGPAPAAAPGARAGSQRSFWDKSKGWIFGEDADIRETPVPLGAPLPPGARNASDPKSVDLAMGSSSDYPKLEEVGDVVPATRSTQTKLKQAEEALMIDRARADGNRDTLASEVAAEPSLLDAYKQGRLPAAPAPQPLVAQTDSPEVSVNLPEVGAAPQPEMTLDLSAPPSEQVTPEMVDAAAAELTPPPPPPPTVNVVRGVQSETVEIREPAAEGEGRGYLPASRYEMRATTTN